MSKKLVLLSIASLFILAPIVAGAIEIKGAGSATTLSEIINLVIKICLMVVMPLAIIAVIIAAFFILGSQGTPDKVQKGRQILTYGLIGLAVVLVGAGSGALLKNIFHTEGEIPGVTYKLPSDYGLPLGPFWVVNDLANFAREEITRLEQELAEAQRTGDQEKIKSLTDQINNYKEQERSLRLWSEQLVQDANDKTMSAADIGKIALEAITKTCLSITDGWCILSGGGKFNLETKEFIDKNGVSYADATPLCDGSILYCSK